MTKCLIICHGFFGDHLFASSVAEKLIQENQFDEVHYVVQWSHLLGMFERNPFITGPQKDFDN